MTVFSVFCLATGALAAVDWEVRKKLVTDQEPLDTAMSADGKLFFVLTSGGKVHIYTSNGVAKETLEIGGSIDKIDVSKSGDVLYLTDSSKKSIQIVEFDFVLDVDIEGAPFRGPVDAPVVITLFTDFQ